MIYGIFYPKRLPPRLLPCPHVTIPFMSDSPVEPSALVPTVIDRDRDPDDPQEQNSSGFLFDEIPEAVTEINDQAGLLSTTSDDLAHTNYALSFIKASFLKCQSPDDVCKLALTTCKLLETRRKLLCLQYGAMKDGEGGKKDQPRRAHRAFDD